MQNPMKINLTTSDEVRAQGWVAEARDADGHLVSTQAWSDICTTNENIKMLGKFVTEYETDRNVTVFSDLVAAKLTD